MNDRAKNTGYVTTSKGISVLVGIVRGFFVPGYLGPTMYGVISLLEIVKTILGFSNMGFNQGYVRLSFLERVKNESSGNISRLQNNVVSFLLIISALGTLITFLIPFVFERQDLGLQRLMIFCFSITAIQYFFSNIGNFYYSTCVIDKRFSLISKLGVLQTILSFTLVMATIFQWGIYGVFIAQLIAVLVVQILYYFKTKIKVNLTIDLKELKRIFVFSFPFFITTIGHYFARFSDRLITTTYLGLKDLGLYSFALILTNNLRILPASISEVAEPYILEDLERQEDIFKLAKEIKSYTYYIAFVNAFIVLNSILFCDYIVFILPAYIDALPVLKMLLINAYIVTTTLFQILLLGTPKIGKQNLINIAMFISGVLNWIISVYLVKSGFGIIGVAWGTLISNSILVSLYFYFAHRYYLKSSEMFFYLKLLIPVFLFMVIMFADYAYPLHNKLLLIERFGMFLILNSLLTIVYFKESKNAYNTVRGILSKIKR